MKLSKYHTFNNYSRLKLSFAVTVDVSFMGLCFMADMSDYRSCLQIAGTMEDDLLGGDHPISSAKMYNLALGKPTSQSSPNVLGSNSSNAVDGVFDAVVMSSLEKDPWWEVDLEGFFTVSQVVLYMTNIDDEILLDSRTTYNSTSDNDGLFVQLFDIFENVVFQSNTVQPTLYKNIIDVPHGIRAAKVRVQRRGDYKALPLTEVQVIELVFKPTVDINVPMGTLFSGKMIHYVAFIQKGVQDEKRSDEYGESYISRLTLQYGYSPAVYSDGEEI